MSIVITLMTSLNFGHFFGPHFLSARFLLLSP
jgi:hypothetical protein